MNRRPNKDIGAAIPFGRSLTYRFAFAGFWSVAAFAELKLTEPLSGWGLCKGLLLRHFRWWSDKHDMFNIDGTLTIGYTYPNMYMSEDYNSPQSPYWAMKSFIALALPENHPFWMAEEEAIPGATGYVARFVKPPMQIVCNTSHHHFLLSSGQFCPWPLKATEAKYGKFAYSSHFGFSVPTGPLLAQMAADSTLALVKDREDIWRVPRKTSSHGIRFIRDIPFLASVWRPWRNVDVVVDTALITQSSWPDWHIRIHRITNNGPVDIDIEAAQGGFAIQRREHRRGGALRSLHNASEISTTQATPFPEATLLTPNDVLICSDAGASGMKHLGGDVSYDDVVSDFLDPDANTNLMWQRTLIPTIHIASQTIAAGTSISFGSSVFAMARRAGLEERYEGAQVMDRWNAAPEFSLDQVDDLFGKEGSS
jgi:hypothetical protein